MKNIYIHAGFGKTGSSALQSWLAINNQKLKESGYHYPVTEEGSQYFKISSGNGDTLVNYLNSKSGLSEFDRVYLNTTLDNIIISSEVLPLYNGEAIALLKEIEKNHDVKFHIIVYMRNIYESYYSHYVQRVKRNNYLESFETYIAKINSIVAINKARFLLNKFENLTILHYDAHLANIAKPFCVSIGLDYDQLKELSTRKVNRTLTLGEIQALQQIGFWATPFKFKNLSQIISDELIYRHPNKHSEVQYSKNAINCLELKFGTLVDDFNKISMSKYNFTLSLSPADNLKPKAYAELPEENRFSLSHSTYFASIMSIIFEKRNLIPNKVFTKVLCNAVDVNLTLLSSLLDKYDCKPNLNKDILREESIKRHNTNIFNSFFLMKQAYKNHSDEPEINKLFRQYKKAAISQLGN